MDDQQRILIVEDDLDLSEMLSSYFRVQNYDISTAAWGEEALRLSREKTFDLVMLDIRLPDIDGYEVCRQLRLQRQTKNVPIIFLTEKRDRVDKLQGLELGVVDYITKPFDIQELRLRVRNSINNAGRAALNNSVTDLPEGALVDERLNRIIDSQDKWALLQLSIHSLDTFREMYGFVAADDVLRAVALMIRNAIREHGSERDFIGHLTNVDFVVITNTEQVGRIRERIETRIRQSREYFYPLRDRDKVLEAMESDYLHLSSGVVDHTHTAFESVDELRAALGKAANPPT